MDGGYPFRGSGPGTPEPLNLIMAFRRKRKSRTVAPAVVHFTQRLNSKGHQQLCVIVECMYGGTLVGPIWSHSSTAVGRALTMLTTHCDCGRRYHKHRQTEGVRILPIKAD